MTWEVTRWEMRVHPTAIIIVQTWIDHPGMWWKWEVKGDTAVKFGYADSADKAKEAALAWWAQFSKTMDAAFKAAPSLGA